MTQDASKVQNGTLKCTGTNDAGLKFDARKVGHIYKEFDNLIKTINKYINFEGIMGYAFGVKNEKLKFAIVKVVLRDANDIKSIKKPVIDIMKHLRPVITAHDVKLSLKFLVPLEFDEYDYDVVEWDV